MSETGELIGGIPAELDKRKGTGGVETVREALRLCFSIDMRAHIPEIGPKTNFVDRHEPVLISWNPRRGVRQQLLNAGYRTQALFRVLPSMANPRWLIPAGRNSKTSAGLMFYKPFSLKARAMKTVLTRLNVGCFGQIVLVAARARLPLETLVAETADEDRPVLALSLGTAGVFRKLTVHVMRPDGSSLGYIKMPLGGSPAISRLRNEAAFVRLLASHEKMYSRLPRLLFGDVWDGRYVVFQSSLPGDAGPTAFTESHIRFLRELQQIAPVSLPGGIIVDRVGERWRRSKSRFGTRWISLADATLGYASRHLDSRNVECGPSHGDFAPWNTRTHAGKLTVFDWESGALEIPTVWDQFHFLTQVELFLRKKAIGVEQDMRNAHTALFCLYALETAAIFKDEGAAETAVDHRKRCLTKVLSGMKI